MEACAVARMVVPQGRQNKGWCVWRKTMRYVLEKMSFRKQLEFTDCLGLETGQRKAAVR